MVKDHSDSERGNPLPPHGLLFPSSSKGTFIYVEHWLEREIAQWVHYYYYYLLLLLLLFIVINPLKSIFLTPPNGFYTNESKAHKTAVARKRVFKSGKSADDRGVLGRLDR